jgi:hypothetical protein
MIDDEAMVFDNCNDAVIGTDQRGYLVYSYEKLVEVFKTHGMSEEQAAEWVDYNILNIQPDHYTVIFTATYDDIF